MKNQLLKTIYSYQYPQTRKLLADLWDEKPHFLFDKSYLQSQDGKEIEFFAKWKNWASPMIDLDSSFSHFYPTNGSSEAIREIIYQAKLSGKTLVLLEDDYEGYRSYAEACGLKYKLVSRELSMYFGFNDSHVLVLSQPSSIDGNLWEGFEPLMQKISSQNSQASVYVDLCYVGCVSSISLKNKINLDHSCISGLFMSLSKVFGIYYHRLGGLISKTPELGLVGNQWFKNTFSLELGMRLMDNFSVFKLPDDIKQIQISSVFDLSKELGSPVFPSDVCLLAYSEVPHDGFKRGDGSRFCLTRIIDELYED